MHFLAPFFLSLSLLAYPSGFQEGDWVVYANFRFVTSAAIDQTVVYFGTTGGVIRYDRFANRWLDPMTVTDGLPAAYVENIAYDPNNDRIHVLTRLGTAYYQPTFQKWYSTPDFPIALSRNDFKPGILGMLIPEFGYTYNSGRLSDMNFRSFQLTRGVDDGFNHLYVGSWGLGPAVINPRYGDIKLMPFGLYSDNASAIVRVGGHFWVGGALDEFGDPGITFCDTAMQTFKHYASRYTTGISSASITSALGDGRIAWLGTDYGLLRYDSESETFTALADFSPLPSNDVTSLAADSLWVYVGTDRGLAFVARGESDRKQEQQDTTEDSDDTSNAESGAPLSGKNRLLGWRVNCLKVIADYLYVGTDRGALRRQMNTFGDFEFVNTPEGMLSDDILDVAAAGDSLFFATKNDIIVIDIRSGQTTTISDPGKFGVWHIRKILADNANIWAATDMGLWKYRLADGRGRLFTRGDGMISDDVRAIEIVGDYLWLATPRGVIRFFWNRSDRID
jgi:hypothetical protein